MRGRGGRPRGGRPSTCRGVPIRGHLRDQGFHGSTADNDGIRHRVVADPSIRNYFSTNNVTVAEPWALLPEIPNPEEVFSVPTLNPSEINESAEAALKEWEGNQLDGPWPSREAYLRTHYKLLREDSIRPLRHAIAAVKANPDGEEDPNDQSIGIYDKVYVTGLKLAARGIAFRVSFSLNRVGKNINWEQSKRLVSGSLVALLDPSSISTPPKLAVVASRHTSDLMTPPLEVHLFIPRISDIDIDSQREYIMIEARSAYFEAERHVLSAIQKICRETLPLSQYLVGLQRNVDPPQYLRRNPHLNVEGIVSRSEALNARRIITNPFKPWPANLQTELDSSQLSALKNALTKELAIIQGPPGTGKTFVSVQILKVLLASMEADDPPIIITAQTNHSLDQLLRFVANITPDFIRLGGRTKDQEIVEPRTLFNVKRLENQSRVHGGSFMPATKQLRQLQAQIAALLQPLGPDTGLVDSSTMLGLGLLTRAQYDSLETGSDGWVHAGRAPEGNRLQMWLGKQLFDTPTHPFHLIAFEEFEDNDRVMEEIKETEAEAAQDQEEFDELSGAKEIVLRENMTALGSEYTPDYQVRELLEKNDNLWNIPAAFRAPVYRYLVRCVKSSLNEEFRRKAESYDKLAHERKIGRWEEDLMVLKKQKIVGVTTTGMSKYRPLLAALKSKIILVEEAAETLEAPIIASCLGSLEHLILVGDHRQLRPRCHVQELELPPYNLNVSLFERLVNNDVHFDLLDVQRRMHPGISRLLVPVYGQGTIKDHPIVSDREARPLIPGMGRLRTWFHHHRWVESRDEHQSSFNQLEAEMIIGFIKHLMHCGFPPRGITVLTFYNGQRRCLLRLIRADVILQSKVKDLKVTTVDSYQGEENDVVILSLVRSENIGFVGNENRICVSLSRARRGFYMFGNSSLLCRMNRVWSNVIKILRGDNGSAGRFGNCYLAISCVTHQSTTNIKHPSDWNKIGIGCEKKCGQRLHCGHVCEKQCHPPTTLYPHACSIADCANFPKPRIRSVDTIGVGQHGFIRLNGNARNFVPQSSLPPISRRSHQHSIHASVTNKEATALQLLDNENERNLFTSPSRASHPPPVAVSATLSSEIPAAVATPWTSIVNNNKNQPPRSSKSLSDFPPLPTRPASALATSTNRPTQQFVTSAPTSTAVPRTDTRSGLAEPSLLD